MKSAELLIRKYLPNVIHLSLATYANNKPWVCEVHYAYDDELNLYFISLPTRRHSEEITKNPNVAGNIVTHHGLGEKPQGVYFEGKAEILPEANETDVVYVEYLKRFSDRTDFVRGEIVKKDGHRFYKITVSDFYVFDVRGELSPPGKHHLSWKNA